MTRIEGKVSRAKLPEGGTVAEGIVISRSLRFPVSTSRPGGIGFIDTRVTRPEGKIENIRPRTGEAPIYERREESTTVRTLTTRGAMRRGGRRLNKLF